MEQVPIHLCFAFSFQSLCRDFMCNYYIQFLQGAKITAQLFRCGFMCYRCTQHAAIIPTCCKACSYCSVLHAIISHETTALFTCAALLVIMNAAAGMERLPE